MSLEFREEMTRLAEVISSERSENKVSEVASELECIFGASGYQALLSEFSSRYEVSLDDAVKRPIVFRQALFCLLGDLGSKFVIDRLERRLDNPPQLSAEFMTVP